MPWDLLVQLPCYSVELFLSSVFSLNCRILCFVFQQGWKEGLGSLFSVNFGGVISEQPGTHNNLSFD